MRAIVDQGWIRLRTERSDGAVPLVMRRASFGLHLRSLGPVPFLPTPRHAGLHHPPSAPRVRRPGRDSFRLFPLPSLSLSVPASPGTRHAPTERRRHRIWPCHLAEPSASVAATVTLVLSVLLTPLEPTPHLLQLDLRAAAPATAAQSMLSALAKHLPVSLPFPADSPANRLPSHRPILHCALSAHHNVVHLPCLLPSIMPP